MKSIFVDRKVQQSLKNLHAYERYVVTTTDKAGGNNAVFICKKFYHERILNELGACRGSDERKGKSTYKDLVCSMSVDSIIKSHVDFCKRFGIDLANSPTFIAIFPLVTQTSQKAIW